MKASDIVRRVAAFGLLAVSLTGCYAGPAYVYGRPARYHRHYYRPAYARPVYYAPRPVYVAPRPVYVPPPAPAY